MALQPAGRAGRGPPRIVIIGGGFAGLACARGLRGAAARITLLDRKNHHVFQPLLYQVATAALSPADIAAPIRRVLRRQRNTDVLLADARSVDLARRIVHLDEGEIGYDVLVIAAGATHSYFGHEEWASCAPGLKTVEDALEIRRRVLLAFERAERAPDPAACRSLLTFVVVGGGPTGVELAGALKEIALRSIPRDFRHIDTTLSRIVLVEGGERLLSAMPAELSERAKIALERMGVEVRLGKLVTHIDGGGVNIGDERIGARTVLWAAGVHASPLARSLGVELDRAGRVRVDGRLRVPRHPEVLVLGDLAAATDARGVEAPGVAPAALQMGRYAARLIGARLAGAGDESVAPFVYRDKGLLAAIGRARAVAAVRGMKFSGLFAWLLWALVHIMYLITFRSRLLVMIQWTWEYLAFQKGARLITGEPISGGGEHGAP